MKKQLLCSFTLLAFFATSVASANPHESHSKGGNPPDERMSTLMSLGILTVVSTAIYQGGKHANINPAALGLLHAANVLYNVGQVTDRPLLKDWAVRTLLAGTASAVASHKNVAGPLERDPVTGKVKGDPKAQLVANIPMVGEALQQAGAYGAGVMTVAFYNVLGYAYEAFRDRTPAGKFLGLN
jgi:hypothetical protein